MSVNNESNYIFLINRDCRAMLGIFEADDPQKGFLAKRELFKTFDKSIKPGDLVMCETGTRHKVSVIKIIEADVEVDFKSAERTRWVIGKVDMHEYDRLAGLEADAIQKIKAAELRKQRDDMKKALFADHLATLEELEIAKTGSTALPAPETVVAAE